MGVCLDPIIDREIPVRAPKVHTRPGCQGETDRPRIQVAVKFKPIVYDPGNAYRFVKHSLLEIN